MGRPRGSQTKPQLNPADIIEPESRKKDENQNNLPASASAQTQKIKVGTRNAKKSKTRQIYADLVGPPIDLFPPTKLPQNKVVLQRYLALREKHPKEKISALVNILHNEIVTGIWVPARIFTEPDKLCKQLIQNVIFKFNKFKTSPFKGDNECPKNLSQYKMFLVQLCDLAPYNLKELLQSTYRLNKEWEEDWQFYLNMCKVKQVGCVAGRDIKLAGKEDGKTGRVTKEKMFKKKTKSKDKKCTETVTGAQFDDQGELDKTPSKRKSDQDDPDIVCQKSRSKRSKLILEIDPAKLVGLVCQAECHGAGQGGEAWGWRHLKGPSL